MEAFRDRLSRKWQSFSSASDHLRPDTYRDKGRISAEEVENYRDRRESKSSRFVLVEYPSLHILANDFVCYKLAVMERVFRPDHLQQRHDLVCTQARSLYTVRLLSQRLQNQF
jgi:hypothetical protein